MGDGAGSRPRPAAWSELLGVASSPFTAYHMVARCSCLGSFFGTRRPLMPPLYRMPVFYIGLVILGLTVGAVRAWDLRAQPKSEVQTPNFASTVTAAMLPPSTAAHEPSEGGSAADGILPCQGGVRPEGGCEGARRTMPKILCPTRGVPTGPVLDYFSIHFVYGESGLGDQAMIQIGPSLPPALGWILASSLFEVGYAL